MERRRRIRQLRWSTGMMMSCLILLIILVPIVIVAGATAARRVPPSFVVPRMKAAAASGRPRPADGPYRNVEGEELIGPSPRNDGRVVPRTVTTIRRALSPSNPACVAAVRHRRHIGGGVGLGAAGASASSTVGEESEGLHLSYRGRGQLERGADDKKLPLTILLIDNHDSYTYNLYQYLSEICRKVVVVTNDVCESWDGVLDHLRNHHGILDGVVDGIVIGPGPGRPDVDSDVGVCKDAILSNPDLPILGVCLGHQLLAHLAGVEVTLADVGPMHGRITPIRRRLSSRRSSNDDDDVDGGEDDERDEVRDALAALFGDWGDGASPMVLPGVFNVTRYHSLSVRLPSTDTGGIDHDDRQEAAGGRGRVGVGVIPLARGVDDDEVMALVVNGRPRHVGVQFHPESIGTQPHGKTMLHHWCRYCVGVKEKEMEEEGAMRRTKDDVSAAERGLVTAGDDGGVVDRRFGNAPGMVVNGAVVDDPDGATVAGSSEAASAAAASDGGGSGRYRILVHRVSRDDLIGDVDGGNKMVVDPEAVFTALYSHEEVAFWLDSSNAAQPGKGRGGVETGKDDEGDDPASSSSHPVRDDPNSRFSIMGTDDGLFSHVVEYHAASAQGRGRRGREVRVRSRLTPDRNRARNRGACTKRHDESAVARGRWIADEASILNNVINGEGKCKEDHVGSPSMTVEVHPGVDIFTYLKRELFGLGNGVGVDGGGSEVIGERNGDNVHSIGVSMTPLAPTASVASSYELLDRDCVLGGLENGKSVTVPERECAGGLGVDDHPRPLPFGYRGGYVGYVGYEARHDAQRHLLRMENFPSGDRDGTRDEVNAVRDLSRGQNGGNGEDEGDFAAACNETVPDAAFLFSDRSIVFDHFTGDVYLIGYALRDGVRSGARDNADTDEEELAKDSVQSVLEWMRFAMGTLSDLVRIHVDDDALSGLQLRHRNNEANDGISSAPIVSPLCDARSEKGRMLNDAGPSLATPKRGRFRHSSFVPRRPKRVYESNIARCHDEIRNGESYELCLTNQFELDTASVAKVQHSERGGNGLEPSERKEISSTRADENVRFVEPYDVYRQLRRSNSAPFAAFLSFDHRGLLRRRRHLDGERMNDREKYRNEIGHVPNGAAVLNEKTHARDIAASVAICCSSPERFLSLSPRTGILESKPIKGTSPRGSTPEIDNLLSTQLKSCGKNQAENLMIVDLVRNDFGRLCDVGTVEVPKFCDVESYTTVHQLVSTIRGRLFSSSASPSDLNHDDRELTVPSHKTAVDAMVSCFPGGSMTGAPKARSMEILHELEGGQPRGPYAGCIGYISPNNAMDMNIVIRTAVMSPSSSSLWSPSSHKTPKAGEVGTRVGMKISVGAGGAITALSDTEDEYQEMMLKSNAVIDAILTVLNNQNNDNVHDEQEDDGAIPPAEGEQLLPKRLVL